MGSLLGSGAGAAADVVSEAEALVVKRRMVVELFKLQGFLFNEDWSCSKGRDAEVIDVI